MTQPDKQFNTKWLILIPTEFERGLIANSLTSESLGVGDAVVEVCGFGPIVPAARTVQLIQQYRPDRVLLIGIAGAYDLMLAPGTAFSFSEVACYGVGVGTGGTFRTARQMGWEYWPGTDDQKNSIGDSIALSPLSGIAAHLLTVCAAAENDADVKHRLTTFPAALAEDMEGFAVAAAGKLCSVPVSIVRGISNRAGDRNKANWKIRESLIAAVELVKLGIGRAEKETGSAN